MSFDVSRVTFDPWKDFNGVVMEQGRVQLDSDWNEWLAEVTRRIRAGTLDTLGRAVYPATTAEAFLITPSVGSFTIGVGRMYVDGLLVENHGKPAPGSGGWIPPVPAPAPPPGPSWDPALDALLGTDAIGYLEQPYFPGVEVQAPFPDGATGPFLIYLDVWQREVTSLQHPDLVEKAIGFDTTGRLQTVWQVRWLDLGQGSNVTCTTKDTDILDWAEIIRPSAGRLTTGVVQSESKEVCCLAPDTGFTGMENQNYRVVIHQNGIPSAVPAAIQTNVDPPTATFKWSRNNASVATAITAITDGGTTLTVQSTGKDDVLRFNHDDWVEITDDWLELNGQHGELRRIDVVTDSSNTIALSAPVSATSFPAVDSGGHTDPDRHTRLIKWDQSGKVYESDGTTVWWDLDAPQSTGEIPVPPAGRTLILESGITVSFGFKPDQGTVKIGDSWSFAARTLDGTVEHLFDAPPTGIHHHYARLAIMPLNAEPTDRLDCRIPWPPRCGGCCGIEVEPGDDVQAALDSVPEEGGCVCLKTGVHATATPLQLRSSRTVLHGESPGAIVHSTGVSPTLVIGDFDAPVTDIVVEGIRFEATGGQISAHTLIQVSRASRVRIENCVLEAIPGSPTAFTGIALAGVTDVRLISNRMSNLRAGIATQDYDGELCITENNLKGTLGTFLDQPDGTAGQTGILIATEHTRPCRVAGNRIEDFWTGIHLGRRTDGSTVSGNDVLRRGGAMGGDLPAGVDALLNYLDTRFHGIDIESARCEVRNNRIQLPGAAFGGIRTIGSHSLLASNVLHATRSVKGVGAVPGGISCLTREELGAHHSEVRNNRLLGAQTGIVLSGLTGVVAADNHVDGEGAGWYGILLDDCVDSRVEDNDLRDVFFAVYLEAGARNRVARCRVDQAFFGVGALRETDVELAGNVLRSCVAPGVALVTGGSTALLQNQVRNCGLARGFSFGIAVIAHEILTESGALTRIEGCEVLDTGLDADGNQGPSPACIGIGAWLPACQITDNRVGYTLREGLDGQGEHRALALLGPRATPTVSVPVLFGSALLSGNHFRGPGWSALVELVRSEDFAFKKVTFNDSYCDHLLPDSNDNAATVFLWGQHLIASGNHVVTSPLSKAVRSILLNGPSVVALVTGNMTTGHITLLSPSATSIVNFNIQVPL